MFTKEEITNKVFNGDCLEVMQNIPDGSIDLIICDLPYETTYCSWDTIIPFEPLWEAYKRIIKPNGAILLYASAKFCYTVMNSNPKWYKYDYVWYKNNVTNFANAKKQPMRKHEQVLVFYDKPPVYNPQGIIPVKHKRKRKHERIGEAYNTPTLMCDYIQEFTNYPHTILHFDRDK